MNKTDWNDYYRKSRKAKTYISRFTIGNLIRFIDRYTSSCAKLTLCELGGAGSRACQPLLDKYTPERYIAIDNNAAGLELLKQRISSNKVLAIQEDVLNISAGDREWLADVVFSLGLIEHFNPQETRQVVETHFKLCKSNGLIVISFPTATWLYRISRMIAEASGFWRFPDERPIQLAEIESIISGAGQILAQKTIWPIFFTQAMVVIRKT